MAGYAFRTFDERKRIEDFWEAGTPAKDIATKLNISASALYTELRRGGSLQMYQADFHDMVKTDGHKSVKVYDDYKAAMAEVKRLNAAEREKQA